MVIVKRNPVPVYEITCPECKSVIRYVKAEVFTSHIACPVCGVSAWADTIYPVEYCDADLLDDEDGSDKSK